MKGLRKTTKFKVKVDKRLDELDVTQVAPEKMARINDLVRNIKLPDTGSDKRKS